MESVSNKGNSTSSKKKHVPPFRGYYYDKMKNRYFKMAPREYGGKYNHEPRDNEQNNIKSVSSEYKLKTTNIVAGLRNHELYISNFEKRKLHRLAIHRNIRNVSNIRLVTAKGRRVSKMLANEDGSRVIGVRNGGEKCMLLQFYRNEHGKVVQKDILELPVAEKHLNICYTHLNSENESGIMLANCDNKLFSPSAEAKTYVGIIPRLYKKLYTKDDILGVWFNRGTPFACAASQFPHSPYPLSYSDGRRVVLVSHPGKHFKSLSEDITRNRCHLSGGPGISVYKLRSDVKCQCFSPVDPLHFNGLRNGQVHGTDLRMRLSTQSSCIDISTEQGLSVKDMLCHRNRIYFFVNLEGVNCMLRKYDLRFTKRCLFDFHGSMGGRGGKTQSLDWSHDGEHIVCNYSPTALKVSDDIDGRVILHEEIGTLDSSIYSLLYKRNWKMFKGESAFLYSDYDSLKTLTT